MRKNFAQDDWSIRNFVEQLHTAAVSRNGLSEGPGKLTHFGLIPGSNVFVRTQKNISEGEFFSYERRHILTLSGSTTD